MPVSVDLPWKPAVAIFLLCVGGVVYLGLNYSISFTPEFSIEKKQNLQVRIVEVEKLTSDGQTSVYASCDFSEVVKHCEAYRSVDGTWEARGSSIDDNACGTSAEPGDLLRVKATCEKTDR